MTSLDPTKIQNLLKYAANKEGPKAPAWPSVNGAKELKKAVLASRTTVDIDGKEYSITYFDDNNDVLVRPTNGEFVPIMRSTVGEVLAASVH